MREVGVHLEDEVVAVLERPLEPGDVRPSQAILRHPVQHVHPRLVRRELVGQLPGAVGRVVVHHQDLEARVLQQDRGDDLREVLALVVGGDDDERALRHPASAARNAGTTIERQGDERGDQGHHLARAIGR